MVIRTKMQSVEAKDITGETLKIQYLLNTIIIYSEEDYKLIESYGVTVINEKTGEVDELYDITVSKDEILKLIKLLSKNLVTPLSMRYVVEDWL